jgi:hypothetical protein
LSFLRAFDRTPGGQKSGQIGFTVSIAVHPRLNPVAMPGEPSWSSPAPSAPTRAVRSGGEEEERAQDPPLFSLCSLHVADHRDRARADPQHPVAATKPRQHASKAAVPGVARPCRQGPRTGELVDALAPDSLAYKNPR